MTRVRFLDSDLTIVTVHITPSWWERLLGDRERDSGAYLDRRLWFWRLDGRYVGDSIAAKIWAQHRSEASRMSTEDRVRVAMRADE